MKRPPPDTRVAVLADDLIWSTRLSEQLRSVGAEPVAERSLAGFVAALAVTDPALGAVDAAIVDLTARGYDGVEAVGLAAATGRPVLAIGQHDDHALRRRALAAGAQRVLAYRKLADDGPRTLAAWLAAPRGPG